MKKTLKKPFYKKWWFWLIVALFIIGTINNAIGDHEKQSSDKNNDPKKEEPAKLEVLTKSEEKPKNLTLEEQSKKFIDENLEGKTIVGFTNKLLTVENEELVDMIVLGHKNGMQFEDDFDLLGRKATASGVITEFAFESSNIGQKRRREGSTTAVRTDKFTIYMGNKDIENYEYIEYDELIYPEEITNFAIIDLDQEADLTVGQQITVEGTIANYVLRKDYSDESKVDEFNVLLNDAVLK